MLQNHRAAEFAFEIKTILQLCVHQHQAQADIVQKFKGTQGMQTAVSCLCGIEGIHSFNVIVLLCKCVHAMSDWYVPCCDGHNINDKTPK